MILKNSLLPLVKAFIDAEANDYSPPKSQQWKDELYGRLMEKLARLKNTNYLVITSSGNMTLSRALVLDAFEGTNRFNYEVHFCPCGRVRHSVVIRKMLGTSIPIVR